MFRWIDPSNRQPLRLVLLMPLFAWLLAGCAVHAQPALQIPIVPESLRVASGEEMVLLTFAEGVQVYRCQADEKEPGQVQWTFVAPEASLYDAQHNEVGVNYAGPTWELHDGSKVVAEVVARVDAPEAGSIPWLLLRSKYTEGIGTLSRVTSIHRIETTGGQPPVNGCDANHLDEMARVPYTAFYAFYAVQ